MTGPSIKPIRKQGRGEANLSDPWSVGEMITYGRYRLTYEADNHHGIYRVHLPGGRRLNPEELVTQAAERGVKLVWPRMVRITRGAA